MKKMSKNERYLKNRKSVNRRYLLSIIFVIAIAFIGFRQMNQIIQSEISTIRSQISDKNSEIESVKVDINSIKEDYKERNSDKFKEKVARERLGMVKADEYVYKDQNN